MARTFKEAVEKAGIQASSVYLFGSYAHGTPHPWSDVDIAVVSPEFGEDYTNESVLLNRIADKINPLIEAHPLSEAGLHDRWSTFASAVLAGELI